MASEVAFLVEEGLEEQYVGVVEFLEFELDVEPLKAWSLSNRNDIIIL